MKGKILLLVLGLLFLITPVASAWNNGDANDVYYSVRFGAHDWIANNAMLFLPAENRTWYAGENITYFLQGTEAPDNGSIDLGDGLVGYGDKPDHHNYYTADYSTTLPNEDAASVRAQEEFDKALNALNQGKLRAALFYAGAMTHYIADLAVWGHTMDNETNHSYFENSADNKMDKPDETFFTVSFDGVYDNYTAYDNHTAYHAAFLMGQETAGNGSGIYTNIWMDNNYAAFGAKTQPETVFDFRVEYLINNATNLIADQLYYLFNDYAPSQHTDDQPTDDHPWWEDIPWYVLLLIIIVLVILLVVIIFLIRKKL